MYNVEILYAYEGESILLKCPFTANNDVTVWYGPPKTTIYSYDAVIGPLVSRRERLSMLQNSSSEAYNLEIRNLKRNEDEGIYRCVVESSPNYQQENISLKFYSRYQFTCSLFLQKFLTNQCITNHFFISRTQSVIINIQY